MSRVRTGCHQARRSRLLIVGPFLMCPVAHICWVNTELLFLRSARQPGIPDFIKAFMLVFQLCPQLIELRFDQPQHCIGFFNHRMITLLWSTWDEDSVSSDAG